MNAEPSGVEEVGIQLISLSSPELSRDKEPDPTLRWKKLERERSDKIVHNYDEWRKIWKVGKTKCT